MNAPVPAGTILLQAQEDAPVPARPAPFVIRDRFKSGADVRFSTVWAEFKSRFFRQTEAPAPAMTMRKYKLLAFAPDGPIITVNWPAGAVNEQSRTTWVAKRWGP